ncbi:Golgi SNAP receptor complex member 2 [Sarcoptes scabiei]|uniref:Golgi SNAP receptor complex member 2 n=1 Tax=Sarcoptes scabiei TaxID=52283 RepID=A0A132AKJ8_SARSC|nr:Golgi SNAP receptor complex member 2 [Sarcoptes scabiei]KPM11494.1 Golgi SNAP receptor complex member 2-like protein [Sarcoptes scabiei]
MDNFLQAHKIIDEIHDSLIKRLESCRDSQQAQAIEKSIDERLKQLEIYIDKSEIALNKSSGPQRSTLKFKTDQLKYDHKQLLNSFRTLHQRRLHREREQKEREELLTRRFTTNAEARSSERDTHIDLGFREYFDQEREKLGGFDRSIDELFHTGSAVLSNLRQQRSMLANTKRNLLETLNSLGLNNSVMRLIEKRNLGDKFILFGGMISLTIVFLFIWIYLG